MSDREVPETWEITAAGNLATYVRGVTYKKEQSSISNRPGMIPILRANNISGSLVLDDLVFVDQGLVAEEQRVRKGDIVFAMSSGSKKHVGKCATATRNLDAGFGAFCGVLRPSHEVNGSFLSYQFATKAFRNRIERQSRGTNINNLKREHLLTYEVALPPIKEQDRIAAKIEELFSELDKGAEALKNAREQLKVYRETVVDHAVGGAKSDGFQTYPLAALIGPIQQGWSPKCDLNRAPLDCEWAIIKTTAVQPMQYLAEECKPLPDDLEPREGIAICDGDILMTRKGPRSRTGVVCLVRKSRPRSMLCDTVYRFRSNEDLVIPEYLEIALNAPRVVAQIDSKKSGINDSGISLNHGRIKSIQLPVPKHKARQAEIVRATEEILSKIGSTEWEVDQQIARSEVLKQAILKKAFCGQLVAQDPNDEPASVLLEQIRAEMDEAGNDNNNRKRKKRTST